MSKKENMVGIESNEEITTPEEMLADFRVSEEDMDTLKDHDSSAVADEDCEDKVEEKQDESVEEEDSFDDIEIEKGATTKIAQAVGLNKDQTADSDSIDLDELLEAQNSQDAVSDEKENNTAESLAEKGTKKQERELLAGTKTARSEFRTERDAFELRAKRRLEAEERQKEIYEENVKWQLIQSHKKKKSILKGNLISIEETTSNDGLLAVVEYAGYRVLIPFREMFAKEPIANIEGLTKEEIIRRHRLLMLKLLGAEVEFVIAGAQTVTDPKTKTKTKIVIGSRKAALGRTRRYYFGKNSEGERRINIGDKIKQVPIIAVGRESVRVVIGGVETSIKKNRLSYKYISNVAAEFKVGMKIDVIIMDIIENNPDDSSDVSILANHKITYLPFFKENIKNCKPGGYYKAQITNVQSHQFYLFLPDINAPAFCRVARFWDVSDLPKPGDEVIFMANVIDTKLGVVHGVITRTL